MIPKFLVLSIKSSDKFYVDKIYPVPANEMVTLDLFSGKDKNIKIEVSDLAGRQLLNQNQNLHQGVNSINLYLDNLENGNYIISISDQEKVIRTKLIKE